MSSSSAQPQPGSFVLAQPLKGECKIPGDKSISHRSLMLGALAVGETVVSGMLEGEDVIGTANAMRALGAEIERDENGLWHVWGRGVGGLVEPEQVLDMGNAGTGVRLIMGICAGYPMTVFFTGDASLRKRPMGRVAKPLENMGASFISRDGYRLPMGLVGARKPMPQTYELPVPSAQVKSAVLFAGLMAPGTTTVLESEHSRDHSERMLRFFGADVQSEQDNKHLHVQLQGQPSLKAANIVVPGDPSSAAFPIVAATICPGSDVMVRGVGLNPLRTGLFDTLVEMGADLTFFNQREEGGEPVADVRVRHAELKGVDVPPARAPSMIDEYPILAVAASVAQGQTRMNGLAELRVKESDRLAAVAKGLTSCGVSVEEGEDYLVVNGKEGQVPGGGTVETELDHRLAMSFLILGLVSAKPVTVDDIDPIKTSFPNFLDLMAALGARLQ